MPDGTDKDVEYFDHDWKIKQVRKTPIHKVRNMNFMTFHTDAPNKFVVLHISNKDYEEIISDLEMHPVLATKHYPKNVRSRVIAPPILIYTKSINNGQIMIKNQMPCLHSEIILQFDTIADQTVTIPPGRLTFEIQVLRYLDSDFTLPLLNQAETLSNTTALRTQARFPRFIRKSLFDQLRY